MEQKKQRMQELVQLLNQAGKAYYQDAKEIMSNHEYDRLYDELLVLEQELGITMANSPTVNVGYEVLSELPKERHEKPMLSLDKTKETDRLKEFVGEKKAVISWKLDGLTIVLTYENGELKKAVTRGNGEVGEVITNNAKVFQNVPLRIAYRGELILRGEAVIGYRDFEKINEEIEDVDAKYKNPRNLCSGSVRQLNNKITARRNVQFYAFSLVKADGVDFQNSRNIQLEWLKEQGFDVVEHYEVTKDTLEERVRFFAEHIEENDIPSDGLVLTYDDIAYGQSLGSTAKFPRDSFAFKWADEIRETTLREIEWSPSRTGLINPVAIFDPVELEGTTVSRASVHNLSIMEELELGIGDTIQVYKASEATLEKFITRGFIHHFSDIFHLERHGEEIRSMEGFGEKSYKNLQDSIEKARTTTLPKLIYGLGIANIGLSNAKMICRAFDYDVEKMLQADVEALNEIQGVGDVIARAFVDYFAVEDHREEFFRLLEEVKIPEEETTQEEQIFAGMNFVITGSVEHFANRNEVKEVIESKGGKVTGSVTSKTNWLINNDVESTSSKNKKARELGIPIISEDTFLKMIGNN